MTWIFIIGAVLSAWAFLSLLSGEREIGLRSIKIDPEKPEKIPPTTEATAQGQPPAKPTSGKPAASAPSQAWGGKSAAPAPAKSPAAKPPATKPPAAKPAASAKH